MFRLRVTAAIVAAALLSCSSVLATPPEYNIIDIGMVSGGWASQGVAVSSNGIATGRSLGSGANYAFSWTQTDGRFDLPNLTSPARAYSQGNGVNSAGVVVGTGAATPYGSSPLPLIWQNGVVSQLPLPAGQTLGRAEGINDLGVAVGSVSGGSDQRAAIYSGGTGSVITETTPTGCFANVAYDINNSGLIVGTGWDPNDASRNVGYAYDSVAGTAFEVGALPGCNGALCFEISDTGYVVGASMMGQGSGSPFIWNAAGGMQGIPLPPDAIMGSAYGVNDAGWAVGTAASAYALPFLYDGSSTYLISELIPAGTGWDLDHNTSSSAMGISNDGIIIGTGELNGEVHAYALVPVPEPATLLCLALAAAVAFRGRRA